VSCQYLRDSERPATLLALWKSKRETDSTRRFYLYFSESVSAGLPRPEPFVPLDASAGDAATASDGDDAVHDLTASDGSSALQTLKRLVGAGGSKSKSSDSGASKSPPKSPPVSPRQPQRVVSPAPASKANAPTPSASSSARAVAKPNRSLTEAAVLKSKIESPYRTIPGDLWSDAAEQDTAPAAAASAPAAAAAVAPMPSSDMQFLEDLLNQPIAGGVDDLRALEAARQAEPKGDDDNDDDDDGFRMSLIDRPNDEFMKTIKLSDAAPAAEKPAAKRAAAQARASVEYDADTLDKLAASWLESAAGDAPAAAPNKKAPVAAIASIDQMLAGLDDGDGDPLQLQAISAPPEVDDSAYCQIPKGLSRPSFLKPAGQEPQLFAAKIQRITSQRKVEIEPALEDADELLAELAADENVQRALSPSEELSSWTQRASIHEAAAAAKSAAAAAKSAAPAAAPVEKDEWDFELELEQAQEQLAKELADLNR
jgi:hypothetical protein